MRIGIDCRLWNESGVGRYTRNLVYQLQILDQNNGYVLFALEKDLNKFKIQNSKFKIVRANIKWHSIQEQLRFPSILNKENLDLVHFPYFSVPVFYKKPFVVTIHDLIIDHFPTGQASTLPFPLYKLKLLGYKFIIKKAVKKAQKIITVSNATKNEIIDHLNVNRDKVAVTYEGVDLQITNNKSQITNKSQISNSKIENKNYFLYVGNAYPHKNLERLLKAFQEVKTQNLKLKNEVQDLKLALVGKEDFFYKRLKDKVKKLGLEDSILFYGEASDEELSGLYQNAIALIMPSLMEGFGLPVLEAMANNCLVLASDIPALKEIASDSAIYFNPLKVENIRKIIEDICSNRLNHDEYKDYIQKGFERSKKFSWQKMAQETLNVYSKYHS